MYCFHKGLFLKVSWAGIVGEGGNCFFEGRGGCWVDVRMIERVLRFVE